MESPHCQSDHGPLLTQDQLSDIITNAYDFDVNRETLNIFGGVFNNEKYYLVEFVWATSELFFYRDTISIPIRYQLTLYVDAPITTTPPDPHAD